MTERLLKFIWQFQYFNTTELETTNGDPMQVIHPGHWNNQQGPDFGNARIRIGDKYWAGNVELHLYASDWKKHEHQYDKNYENIILHVVWIDDDIRLSSKIPTLVLQDRIPRLLLQQYEMWMQSNAFIPCSNYVNNIDPLVWTSWKDRLLIERLNRKCAHIQSMLDRNNTHWEETLWWLLARNFGLHVNADAFEELARSIPVKVINWHRKQIHQLEALLMGQAGLLKDNYDDKYFKQDKCLNEDKYLNKNRDLNEDKYFILLKKEYEFLSLKYKLEVIHAPVHFLRMRPPAFPTIRLAQLAMLMHSSGNLLSVLLEATNIKELKKILDVTANDYWHYHYTFEQTSAYNPKALGAAMIDTIIINTFSPVVYAYGVLHKEEKYIAKALDWLYTIKSEKNSILNEFSSLGIKCKSAADSQSLLELKTHYCDKKRCLDCAVGNSILKR